MSAYNKLFAAILSTLVTRWIARYFGLDVYMLGLVGDLQGFIELATDFVFAAVNGFFVWLLPNRKPPSEDEDDYYEEEYRR